MYKMIECRAGAKRSQLKNLNYQVDRFNPILSKELNKHLGESPRLAKFFSCLSLILRQL